MRNGMTAAAVAGGALALVVPAMAVSSAPPAADRTTTTLALRADAALEAAGSEGPGATAEPGGWFELVGGDDVRDIVALGSLLPVTHDADPVDPTVDAAELLKAVGLEDIARRAAEERAAREAAAHCDADLRGLGSVRPWVRSAAQFLSCLYGQPDLLGVGGRGRVSDHPLGLAVDLMVRGDRGDRIAECALANQEALGISYVIWKQRVNYGDGWERMEDRGSDTENHFDHVHISFERGGPGGNPAVALCG